MIPMNDTQIKLFLAQVEVPLVEDEIDAVTKAIDDFFRWEGDFFAEAVDAAFEAALDAERGDEVHDIWLKARDLAKAALPEGIDPQIARDVDSLVGSKALQVATFDLADDGSLYNVQHSQFLDAPWNAVFGFTTE
jgi:hypothetical protein